MSGTEIDAVELIGRIYPESTATVEDGCDEYVVGVAEDHSGNGVASFCRLFRPRSSIRETPVVSEIQISAVGQFCGTFDAFCVYLRSQAPAKKSEIPQTDICNSLVPLAIMRIDSGDSALIWGCVGDYEVCIPSSLCRRENSTRAMSEQ